MTKKRGARAAGTAPGASKATSAPKTAAAILRCVSEGVTCLHCSRTGNDKECGPSCYKSFTKSNFVLPHRSIDIKGPLGPRGYGAFTRPGVRIAAGSYFAEYVGMLRPLASALADVEIEDEEDGREEREYEHEGSDDTEHYRFEIPRICAVDASRAGNWTRFINSSCRPNAKPWGEFVGKRHVIVFQALREIQPEEEIVFSYGRAYFEKAGLLCRCNVLDKPHLPGQSAAAVSKLKGGKEKAANEGGKKGPVTRARAKRS